VWVVVFVEPGQLGKCVVKGDLARGSHLLFHKAKVCFSGGEVLATAEKLGDNWLRDTFLKNSIQEPFQLHSGHWLHFQWPKKVHIINVQ
jgi:hypothetical protein